MGCACFVVGNEASKARGFYLFYAFSLWCTFNMKHSCNPLVWLFLILLSPSLVSLSAKPKWDPISPEDMALTECKAYPGAPAEYLFERVTMESDDNRYRLSDPSGNLRRLAVKEGQNWVDSYRRIKIYNLQGVQQASLLNIEYLTTEKASNIYARVTKPDGRTVDYDGDAFSESVIAKADGRKWMRRVLAVPDLSIGDIVEFKWSQVVFAPAYSYWWGYCQEDQPIRDYVFDVKSSANDYEIATFNTSKAELKKIDRGHLRLEIRDIPPYKEEAYMPPERDVRDWLMLFYTGEEMRSVSQKKLMDNLCSYWADDFHLVSRSNSAIKAKAVELTKGIEGVDGKLRALYEFCQNNITNLNYFDSPELQAVKKKLADKDQDDQTAGETLKLKTGYGNHINALFAAMAQSVGFDVRLVKCASRAETLDVKGERGWLFMNDKMIAVRCGEAWRFFCPGDYYVPYGLLHYLNEGVTALVCDDSKVIYQQTPIAPASQSVVSRVGHFTLDTEGTLEGDVEVSMGGHVGAVKKGAWNDKTQEEIDKLYRESVSERLPSAEITELKWENLRLPGAPLIARYKVKIPGYAEVAGSRIILTPSFFEHGSESVFKTDTRKYPILFKYPRAEHDEVEIILPEGYTLDSGSAPANVGDLATALGVQYKLGYRGKSRLLSYTRDFALGGNGLIVFKQENYTALKAVFDVIKKSDEHSIVLKPKPVAAPVPPKP